MSTLTLKRKLSSSARSVSPPPLRRRLEQLGSVSHETQAPRKHTSTWKLYSWNVNGIQPLLQRKLSFQSSPICPLRAFFKDHDWPAFLCLQEVKINRNDEKTKHRVEVAANSGNTDDEPTYSASFALPRDDFNATGFGGKVHGVATLIRDDLLQAHPVTTTNPDWDLEGRVLVHDFRNLPLVVINGYWVNGTSNPYRNSETGEEDGTRHNHKLRFHKHMLDLCKSIEEGGRSVLLLGDVNVAPKRIDGHPNLRTSPIQHVRNRADFNMKFLDSESTDGLRGIDVFRQMHGQQKKYTYHGRGHPWGASCDRVDLIIASRSLFEKEFAIVDTDICDNPKDRGHSDHVPLWVELDTSSLFDSDADRVEL